MPVLEELQRMSEERFLAIYEALAQQGFGPLDGEVANPVLATLVFVLARPCHGIRSWNPLFNPLRAHSVETNRRMITQPPSRRGMSDKWDGRFLELAKHIEQYADYLD